MGRGFRARASRVRGGDTNGEENVETCEHFVAISRRFLTCYVERGRDISKYFQQTVRDSSTSLGMTKGLSVER
jgi:hypothetical protein